VALSKKWYSFFVVTDGQAGTSLAPAAATPRRVTDVAPEVPAGAPLEGSEAAGPGAIADVYRSARIPTPAHGYTVLKVADMLQSEHIRALPPDVKRKSIMVALDAAGVTVDEIVQDAVRRDQALDTYERVLEKHLEDLRADKAAENSRIEAEINERLAELRGRIEENNSQTSREQDALMAWRTRKRQEESTIAEAVSYDVSENPVTTATPPTAKGDSDVR
jgi:Asp-tRNA(Asn)/Glu-tRNA(Gln) amidotransferase A subunit family amidase